MPTIDANGLTVAYETAGTGPPLILLHGASTDARSQFGDLEAYTSLGLRAYAPDARGHSGTRFPVELGLRTTDLSDDVVAFADALGLERWHVLGYSMGGMTALHVAARHGARLLSLVVVSAAPEREPRLAVARALLDPERIAASDPDWAAALAARHDPVQGDGAWRRLLPAIVDDVACQPLLGPDELRAIDVPTLVVAGDRDPLVPVQQAAGLARQVRDGRLLILPGVGHDALDGGAATMHAALADFYRHLDAEEDPP